MSFKNYCIYHNEMYTYQNHDMILLYRSNEDVMNAHILRYFDDSFQTTWVVRQGVVSTDQYVKWLLVTEGRG